MSAIPEFVVAIILGLVEGATEFLPVSSTGHLIVAGELLNFADERAATFEVVIQIGAILAVVWHYRHTLRNLVQGVFSAGPDRGTALNIVFAFLPAAVIGLLAHDYIKAVLFSPLVVGWALIIGGFVMLLIEWWQPKVTAETIERVSPRQAVVIGFAQVLAMVPGTSRAAATILGGYGAGLSRSAATEFSFLLAIPTIIGAAGLDGFKNRDLIVGGDLPLFLIGTAVAFVSALLVIRGFLRFIERHTFSAFAWYRIAFGALVLVLVAKEVIGQ